MCPFFYLRFQSSQVSIRLKWLHQSFPRRASFYRPLFYFPIPFVAYKIMAAVLRNLPLSTSRHISTARQQMVLVHDQFDPDHPNHNPLRNQSVAEKGLTNVSLLHFQDVSR